MNFNNGAFYFIIFQPKNNYKYSETNFFSIIILITHTYKTKNITITRYYFIFPVPEKKENSKLKQSEIEVKMIIKMKNRQIVFVSNTKKQTLFDLYEILIVKSLKEFIISFRC